MLYPLPPLLPLPPPPSLHLLLPHPICRAHLRIINTCMCLRWRTRQREVLRLGGGVEELAVVWDLVALAAAEVPVVYTIFKVRSIVILHSTDSTEILHL